MAITPTAGAVSLANTLEIVEQPTLTYYVDPDTKRIRGTADGLTAMRQAVEIILFTKRYRWQIYSPYFGAELDDLIGLDSGYVAAELLRRVRDAFSVDSRILSVEDYEYTYKDGALTASFTVRTIFGNLEQTLEVTIS